MDQEETSIELYAPQKEKQAGSVSRAESWQLMQGIYQMKEALSLFDCDLPLSKIYKPSS